MTAPVCYLHPHHSLSQTLPITLSWSQNPIVRLVNSAIKVNNLKKYCYKFMTVLPNLLSASLLTSHCSLYVSHRSVINIRIPYELCSDVH